MNWNNTENTDGSKKISWTSVLYAVLQALVTTLINSFIYSFWLVYEYWLEGVFFVLTFVLIISSSLV